MDASDPAVPSAPAEAHEGPALAKRRWPRIARLLAILGPGFVAGAVSNDAGSIATYSQAGATYGYDLLWAILLMTVALMVVQEMSGRLGAATGRGLLQLIRERFGPGPAGLAMLVVSVANLGLVATEFVGIGAAVELFGISRYLVIPLAALVAWYLIVAGSYNQVEKVLALTAAVFLAYPVAALLAHPDLGDVARGMLVPTVRLQPAYIALFVGLIGTTISPYQQVYQQSAVAEKGITPEDYASERLDTYIGMIFSVIISAFIVVATAATLHLSGQTDIQSAADAARALQPLAGPAAGALFGVGLLGASLMAAAVLPITTSFAVTEALGLPKGVGLDPRRAPAFFGLVTAALVLGAALAMIPGIPVIQFLIWVQVLNGILLPVILAFMLLLANDPRLMGGLKNSRPQNLLGWTTCALISLAVIFLLGQQAYSLLAAGWPPH